LNKNVETKEFETILLEAIDEAFASLGERVKDAIYFYLEHNFMIARQDIPDKFDDFSVLLERIFGLGARNLELLIMQNLNEKIRCLYRWEGPKWLVPELTFKDYVNLMRQSFENKVENEDTLEFFIYDGEKQEQHT
jgi:hypothetical protein